MYYRDHVIKSCSQYMDHDSLLLGQNKIFLAPQFDSRWALSPSMKESYCVSPHDHGLGNSPVDDAVITNDRRIDGQAQDRRAEEKRWLKEQSVTEPNSDQGALFEFYSDEDGTDTELQTEQDQSEVVKATLEAQHLSRRQRVKHHYQHHHVQQQHPHQHEQKHHHHKVKRDDQKAQAGDPVSETLIRAGVVPGQSVYTTGDHENVRNGGDGTLLHESLTSKEGGQQKALIQGGPGPADPAAAAESLGKASAGQPSNKATADRAASEDQDKSGGSRKGTFMLAAVPILLLISAMTGFTVYRRYCENQGRVDPRDCSSDGCGFQDLPYRNGSPIHFDRTFQNADCSPRPTATYHHVPEGSSCNRSPSSTASTTKELPPSMESLGKRRFQMLSRSYDFSAGVRSIRNALSRSNNNSRDNTLNQASEHPQRSYSGGFPIAKIEQLQQQYSSENTGSSGSIFPDKNSETFSQRPSIVWGFSTSDKRTKGSSMLSSGIYTHQSSRHGRHDTETDYLSPESPSGMHEAKTKRQLFGKDYHFDPENNQDEDSCDEEMNMYLRIEKEESSDDYSAIKSLPYRPMILRSDDTIQKTATLSENEAYLSHPTFDHQDDFTYDNDLQTTHVLGSASPEGSTRGSIDQAVDQESVAMGFGEVQASTINVDDNRELEVAAFVGITAAEPLGSYAAVGQSVRQHGGTQKKKGSKGKKSI
ncbi:hypothetical protein BGZ65_002205 [Modicella reniformis]|uniref:Uncharacterized protein n=1 Tax=Modicella reniformis TaxID=1440133 RepID=A0A9P6MLN3_9FUNG|nr:hypothetical protein BGZ65_002205 [Modicella reniformis]